MTLQKTSLEGQSPSHFAQKIRTWDERVNQLLEGAGWIRPLKRHGTQETEGEHKKNKQGLFILKVREQEPKEENAMP